MYANALASAGLLHPSSPLTSLLNVASPNLFQQAAALSPSLNKASNAAAASTFFQFPPPSPHQQYAAAAAAALLSPVIQQNFFNAFYGSRIGAHSMPSKSPESLKTPVPTLRDYN